MGKQESGSCRDRIKKVENYWSTFTGIPLSQFNKTVLIKTKSKKIYPNFNNYYGTLRITVRQGTRLRRKIHGWIEGLSKTENYHNSNTTLFTIRGSNVLTFRNLL